MNNVKYKKILVEGIKFFIFGILFLLLMCSNILGNFSPFAPMLLFALMWCDQKVLPLGLVYILSSLCYSVEISFLISSVACVFVMMLMYYFHRLVRRPMNTLLVWLYAMLSLGAFAYYYFSSISVPLAIFFVSASIFLFATINVLQAIFLRGIFYKFTLDESVCMFVFVSILFAGLSSVYMPYFSLYKFACILGALLLISLGRQQVALFFCVACGLGASIFLKDMTVVFPLVLVVCSACIFRWPHRLYMCASAVCVDIAVSFLFLPSISWWMFLPIGLACLVFFCLPGVWVENLSDKWYEGANDISIKNIVLVTRKNIRKRMLSLSGVFGDMERLYRAMVRGSLPRENVKDMLYSELSQSICADCIDRTQCQRSSVGIGEQNLKALIDQALDRGKITILDLPKQLTAKCGKTNALTAKINQLVTQYGNYNGMCQNIDNAKILLSETLGGVSKLLVNLGDEIDQNISFDSDREAKIQSRLLANNIICSEIMLYSESLDKLSATLVIKGESAYSPKVEEILSEVCRVPMTTQDVVPSEKSGWQIVSLVRKNKFEITFGLANCKKTGSSISGDCHSLLRLGAKKFLLALSDGMGSGEKAEKLSSLTIGLIENFYRAGFDNEVVLSNVNRLLSVNNSDTYSALDLCLIDLDLGVADLIKVGAPFGLIKRADHIDKIECGALPIGVLEQMTPKITRTTVSVFDTIIMATDGITDAFENVDKMSEFVAGIAVTNPQTIAETILAGAIELNGGIAKDDMTVMVCRIYQKTN